MANKLPNSWGVKNDGSDDFECVIMYLNAEHNCEFEYIPDEEDVYYGISKRFPHHPISSELPGDFTVILSVPEFMDLYKDKWMPNKGDWITVWVEEEGQFEGRVFLAYIENSDTPWITVRHKDMQDYIDGKSFRLDFFKDATPYTDKVIITLQEIADKFGVDVNKIEIR